MPRPSRSLPTRLARTLARAVVGVLVLCSSFACGGAPGAPGKDGPRSTGSVRIATFNLALNRTTAGELLSELESGESEQAAALAAIIQRIRPDLLLLNELDRAASDDGVPRGGELTSFCRDYLEVPQGDQMPIQYRYRYNAPVNTGVDSGLDLDGDGRLGGAGDAFGYGAFPGQYGMAVLSRFPIRTTEVRSFVEMKWKAMPENRIPTDFYSDEVVDQLRLSSKSHWDVPVELPNGQVVHMLASHPTPPVFDGPEDRNGRRNHDEILFWAHYIAGNESSADTGFGGSWIVDDQGHTGGLAPGQLFVILGDLNADPMDGEGREALAQLTASPSVRTGVDPASKGGHEAALLQGGANDLHLGDAAFDTADFTDEGPTAAGNLRVDHVIPSVGLQVLRSGVWWPVGVAEHPSDHRLVWIDLML